jgi:hypothetical protein
MVASVRSRIATGPEAGQPWHRLGDRVESVEPEEASVDAEAPERCVREGGMSLHADVSIPAHDRKRLERLACYILRSPICLDRLEAQPDGRLRYKLKNPWRDGTTHILMERHELLERLAPLIPPPRAHQTRYHGVLAPCASARDYVVPEATPVAPIASPGQAGKREASCVIDRSRTCVPPGLGRGPVPGSATPEGSSVAGPRVAHPNQAPGPSQPAESCSAPSTRRRRLPWADLLQRIFGIEALRCPWGESRRVIAANTDPAVAKRILECMGLAPRAPPLRSASVQGSAATPWFEEPAEDFDQTPPDEWGSDA